ncbi:hypothetical protein ACP179_19450 [Xenorhabdus stockiae]
MEITQNTKGLAFLYTVLNQAAYLQLARKSTSKVIPSTQRN